MFFFKTWVDNSNLKEFFSSQSLFDIFVNKLFGLEGESRSSLIISDWLNNHMNKGFTSTLSALIGTGVKVYHNGACYRTSGYVYKVLDFDKVTFDRIDDNILKTIRDNFSAFTTYAVNCGSTALTHALRPISNVGEKLYYQLSRSQNSQITREQLELFRQESLKGRISIGTLMVIVDLMNLELSINTASDGQLIIGNGGHRVQAYIVEGTVYVKCLPEMRKLRLGSTLPLSTNLIRDAEGNWQRADDNRFRSTRKEINITNVRIVEDLGLSVMNRILGPMFGSFTYTDFIVLLDQAEFGRRKAGDTELDRLCKGLGMMLFRNRGIVSGQKVIFETFRGENARSPRVIYCFFTQGDDVKHSVEYFNSKDEAKLVVQGSEMDSLFNLVTQEQIFVDAVEHLGGIRAVEREIVDIYPSITKEMISLLVLRKLCYHVKCSLSIYKAKGNFRAGSNVQASLILNLFYHGNERILNVGYKNDWGKIKYAILTAGKTNICEILRDAEIKVLVDLNRVKEGGDMRLDKMIVKPIDSITIPEPKTYIVPGERFNIIESEIETNNTGYSIKGEVIIDEMSYIIEKSLMDGDSLDKFPHDIIVDEWLTTTDMSFKDKGLDIQDPTDNLTPDYLSVKRNDEGITEVRMLEIGTTRSTQLDKDFIAKKEKYLDAIKKRANNKLRFSYGILIVGPSNVLTNLEIDQKTATKMVGLFNFAWKIKKTALDSEILAHFSSEELGENKSIKQVFKNIAKFEGNNLLPREVYEELVKPLQPEEMIEMIKLAKQEAINILEGYTDDNFNCLKRNTKTKKMLLDQITEYNTNINRIKGIRDNYTDFSTKAVVQIPLINPLAEERYNRSLENLPIVLNGEGTLTTIVRSIFGSVNLVGSKMSELDRLLLPPELQYELNKKDGNKELKERFLGKNYRGYGVSKPILTEKEWTYLRQRGVEGKRSYHTKDIEIMTYRAEKKKWFTPSVNTNDIEEFLKSKEWMEPCNDPNYLSRIKAKLRLVNKGYNMNTRNEGSDKTKSLTETLLNTKLGRYCCFVSDLGAELASSMTEGLKPGTFRVKKMPHWKDIYLITKSTGKTGVIFYTIVFRREMRACLNYCFKKTHDLDDDWCCTDFVSDEKSTLDNKVKMESHFLTLAPLWREHYYLPPSFNIKNENEHKAFSMLKLTLLVALEDKAKTEEAITLTRYIHLESLVTWPNIKNPGKMISKLNVCPRSRLELWLNKRAIELCKYYVSNESYRVVDGQISWDRFLNPYSLLETEEYQTHEQVVNDMYIGYIKNKDQSGFANNSGQMLSKIVEKEDQLRRTETGEVDFSYIGMEEPPENMGIHEFSPKFVKYLCSQAKLAICKQRGVQLQRYDDMITDDIVVRLKGISVDSLATLKKSSKFGPEYYKYSDYRNKLDKYDKKEKKKVNKYSAVEDEAVTKISEERIFNNSYHRITNMEAIMNLIKEKNDNQKMPNIAYLIPESLKKLEDQGCIHIDIFKKNQHGGLREIYVLEIDARIVQKTIEEISRTIVNNFESETMLHPYNKYIQPEREHVMCKRELGDYVTYSTSDDASKWSQCHVVTKFIMMLTHLTSSDFHPFIARTLSLWLNKKIKLNDELLDVFFNKASEGFNDVCLNTAYRAFNNRARPTWMRPGDTYVTVASGMMQGILHVTSSLFHVIFLDWLKRFCEEWIKSTLKKIVPSLNGVNRRLVRITYLVSSDDSSMTIAYPAIEIVDFPTICKLLASSVFELKTRLSKRLAIHRSVKSTSMTANFYEFNSEFRFGSSEIKPYIKWVMACVQIVENESFLGIQEDFNSLLTKILEGGGSIFLTAMCQISQALLNYRMLGEGLSVVWKIYADLMEMDPDPTTGFFMMDPPLVPGMSGTKYQLWKASSNTNMNAKFRYFLEESVKRHGEHVMEGTEFSGSLFSRTLFFSVGDLVRYRRLLKNIGFEPNVLKILEDEPIILYKPTDTVKEIKIKIFAKARVPGVATSLSGTNTFVSKVASSIYLLSRTVCSCKSDVIKELIYEPDFLKENHNVKIAMLTYLTASSYEIGRKIMELNKRPIEEIIRDVKDVHPSGRIISQSDGLIDCGIKAAQQMTGKFNKDLETLIMNCFRDRLGDPVLRLNLVSSIYKVNFLVADEKNYLGTQIKQVIYSSPDSPCILLTHCSADGLYKSDQIVGDFFGGRGMEMPSLTPAQRLFLFPLSSEYEDHERLINQYQISSELQVGKNIRLKTRLQQNLLWKAKDETPLLHVVQWKWFNIYKKNMDVMTYNRIFDETKAMYQWLADDPKTTLKQSHFETQLEMFHFLSRDPVRSRSLRINSAFIDPNNVTLERVISRNFSNGMVPRIEKSSNFMIKDYNKVMFHLLNCIHQYPFDETVKVRNITDLLIGGPNLVHTNEVTGKRINSLKLIQEVLKSNPDVEIKNFKPYSSASLPNIIFSNSDMSDYLDFKKKIEELRSEYEAIEDETGRELFLMGHEKYQNYILDIDNEEGFRNLYVSQMVDNVPDALQEYSGRSGYFHCLHNTQLTSEELHNKANAFAQKFPFFLREIKTRSVGIFGFYETAQKFEDGKYVGRGVWIGNIGGTDVKLHVNSDQEGTTYLELILVKTTNYVGLYSLLQTWCRDHSVVIKTGSWSLGECADRIDTNFRQIKLNSNQGCKIVKNDQIETIGTFDYRTMQLEMTKTGVRLTVLASVNGVEKPVTLLSCGLKNPHKNVLSDRVWINEDIKQYRRYPEEFKAFVNYQSYANVVNLSEHVLNNENTLYNREDYIEWASSTIKEALFNRAEMAIETGPVEIIDDIDPDYQISFEDDDFNFGELEVFEKVKPDEDLDFDIIADLTSEMMLYQGKRDEDIIIHPFFHNLMSSLSVDDIKRITDLRRNRIKSARVSVETYRLREIIAKAFDVPVTSLVLNTRGNFDNHLM